MMRLKIERVLMLCIVAVLTKNCFEKFTPEVRRLVHNSFSNSVKKTLVRNFSQTITHIEQKFRLEVYLKYTYFVRKSHYTIFLSVPT